MTPKIPPYAIAAGPGPSHEVDYYYGNLAALPREWVAVAYRDTYSEAVSETARIDQLPTVERWWAAVWPARAGGE